MDTQTDQHDAHQTAKKDPPPIVINGQDFPMPNIPEGLKKMVTNSKGGRYQYDREATMNIVCRAIANGKSLVSICKLEGMPDYSTVMDWIEEDEELADKYARARERQADYLAASVPEIAMAPMIVKRVKRKEDDEGNRSVEEVEVDNVERSRLVVDSLKWYASKLSPKKYGDRLQTDLNVQVESHEQRLARLVGGGSAK